METSFIKVHNRELYLEKTREIKILSLSPFSLRKNSMKTLKKTQFAKEKNKKRQKTAKSAS